MLIKLLPEAPHPSVLFNITFEDLPDGMSLPQAWTTHLSNLMHDELTIPDGQHALDKAAFLPCILSEVVFDLPAMSIICRFVDGSIEQWRIDLEGSEGRLGSKCLKTLESVVDDVCMSTQESERERERERFKEREREREREKEKERLRLLQLAASSPPSSLKGMRHKKKRSLLMTIVSSLSSLNSIINLSLPSPTVPIPPPAPIVPLSPPKSPTASLRPKSTTPPVQNICPRFLRRRARSSLVDAFRLYVLHHLTQQVPKGGYYVWILHSLLKAAREHQEAMVARERQREREPLRLMELPSSCRPSTSSSSSSSSSGSLITFGWRKHGPKPSPHPRIEADAFSATTASEPPISDDEDDEVEHRRMGSEASRESDADTETSETDTDGSSIHTPSSSHLTLPLLAPVSTSSGILPSPYETDPNLTSHHHMQGPYPPTPPTDPTEYQIRTLTQLILLHTSHSARTAHDESTRLDALEVRGRRRAWLNRALCPGGLRLTPPPGGRINARVQRMEIGMGAGMGGLGFAVPLRRSTLGMWAVTAEDLERQEEQGEEDQAADAGVQHGGQSYEAMSKDGDTQMTEGERYTGYDERNGIEPKRFKVPVPSRRTQLFPVSEVEEVDTDTHQCTKDGELSGGGSDDDDDAAFQFAQLDLNQYDDLRALQMDLDIVTGVGFDMDSSDEEDGDTNADVKSTEGDLSEGGICVALDIPRPKALHSRIPHLLSGHEQRQRQRQRPRTSNAFNQAHPVHQYQHPNAAAPALHQWHAQDLEIPQRCPTPLPEYPPPGGPQSSIASAESNSSPHSCKTGCIPCASPFAPPISIPEPAHLRAHRTPPRPPSDTLLSQKNNSDALEPMLYSSVPRMSDSNIPASVASERKALLSGEVHVNEMGEFVAGIGIGREEGEEFTLAMDLPSKSLNSRFGELSFAAMGRTKNFRGRVRGASRMGNHTSGADEDVECGWV